MESVLSDEQELVRKSVLRGQSVFLTGCGGTGKSYLTNVLIEDLHRRHGTDKVAVTATTGIAACHIKGTSLHSFAGIGLGDAKDLLVFIKNSKKCKEILTRWKHIKCLVVDEISMLDGRLFDRLNDLAKRIRKNDLPFGGIQLVLVGDFAQLPPVNGIFCFESTSWGEVVQEQVELKKVFRQRNVEFVALLTSIRNGVCTPQITQQLMQCTRPLLDDSSGIQATQLYCKNIDVDTVNMKSVMALPGDSVFFDSNDSGLSPYIEALQKNCLAPSRLVLKPGAQVIYHLKLSAFAFLIGVFR